LPEKPLKKFYFLLARIIFTHRLQAAKNRPMNTLFVAGTDTGVGKTFFCALFLKFLHASGIAAGYQKWISTGDAEHPEDLDFCIKTAGPAVAADIELQVPFRFTYPASPHLAAELEGQQVDDAVISSAFQTMATQYELLIVEGVGGLLVPLRRDLLLVDLLARLRPPVLLVARSGLGTLNHTLLSLEALRSRNIPIVGVVFSDGQEPADETLIADNMKTIAEIGNITVFGRLQRMTGSTAPAAARKTFTAISNAVLEKFPHS
jgi:dethiobiotin synthetase